MRENATALHDLNQVVNPVLLALLLATDVAFILLHILNSVLSWANPLLSLMTDGGYPEMFQYIKEFWIAIALFTLCWRTRQGIYAPWGLLFIYLLCDDALRFHERGGWFLVSEWNYFRPALGLRAVDFGELAVSATAGLVFLVLIAFFYVRSSQSGKNMSKDLTLLLGLLVFFGIFTDMVHSLFKSLPVKGMITIEDGGEMIAMSLIAGYVVHLLERPRHVSVSLWSAAKAALSSRLSQGASARA